MKIRLNRFPYMCPVIEDNKGVKDGSYIFDQRWLGSEIEVEFLKEDDEFLEIKIPTSYNEDDGTITNGWLHMNVLKVCFDVIQ